MPKQLRSPETIAACRDAIGPRNDRARYIDGLIEGFDHLTAEIKRVGIPDGKLLFCMNRRRALAWSILQHAEKYPHLFAIDPSRDGDALEPDGNRLEPKARKL